MYPKTALKILLVIILAIALVFTTFYIKKQSDLKKQEKQIGEIVDKKKGQQEFSEEDQAKLDAYIDQKIEEKRSELDKKTEAEIKKDGYTQAEVDLILDPRRAVEKELGIEEKKEGRQMTQEEIDAILNQ
ncbi:MAG: hypothetical protein PHR36_03255 [Patescibacteria group bacterium]|nr:hypothetical protein [Patescibacteria group bacterium]